MLLLKLLCVLVLLPLSVAHAASEPSVQKRSYVAVRGIYGGVPAGLLAEGRTLRESGVNAVFMHSGSINAERLALLGSQGASVFAEFNTMHYEQYVKEHPDAAPIGSDGEVCPPPAGWQGACPTHPGYRRQRMAAFRTLLTEFDLDGVWLDYHHSHASWEQARPEMPDTCFCHRCLGQFARDTGTTLPDGSIADLARVILREHKDAWIEWRCEVFTGWVREFRDIIDEVRPNALLGTFHNPWTDKDFDGARLAKLAIDLRAQAAYVDVFSPMPYHARFGHSGDPQWISRQVAWLGEYLGIEGKPGERNRIWPIVQLSDWGEVVPAAQVHTVLEHATHAPATGVIVFAWGSLRKQPGKVAEMVRFYRGIAP